MLTGPLDPPPLVAPFLLTNAILRLPPQSWYWSSAQAQSLSRFKAHAKQSLSSYTARYFACLICAANAMFSMGWADRGGNHQECQGLLWTSSSSRRPTCSAELTQSRGYRSSEELALHKSFQRKESKDTRQCDSISHRPRWRCTTDQECYSGTTTSEWLSGFSTRWTQFLNEDVWPHPPAPWVSLAQQAAASQILTVSLHSVRRTILTMFAILSVVQLA